MNPTQFAENLLKAIHAPFDREGWLERLENVLHALEYGNQKPAEITWLEMMQVEESSRILLNPINACPRVIRIEKERLEKKAVEILYSLYLPLWSGRVADGTVPFWKWPGPERIFEECHIFAKWIIDEMEALSETSVPPVVEESAEQIAEKMEGPLETSAPPLVEESAERIAEKMEAPSETSAPPVAGESAEGIGQGTQDCEAGEKIFGIDCVAIQKAFTSKKGFSSTIRSRLQGGKKREGKPNVLPIGKGRSESNHPTDVYDYQVVANILWDEYRPKAKPSLNTKNKIQKSLKKACRDFTVS
jgi:hypothetical protein